MFLRAESDEGQEAMFHNAGSVEICDPSDAEKTIVVCGAGISGTPRDHGARNPCQCNICKFVEMLAHVNIPFVAVGTVGVLQLPFMTVEGIVHMSHTSRKATVAVHSPEQRVLAVDNHYRTMDDRAVMTTTTFTIVRTFPPKTKKIPTFFCIPEL